MGGGASNPAAPAPSAPAPGLLLNVGLPGHVKEIAGSAAGSAGAAARSASATAVAPYKPRKRSLDSSSPPTLAGCVALADKSLSLCSKSKKKNRSLQIHLLSQLRRTLSRNFGKSPQFEGSLADEMQNLLAALSSLSSVFSKTLSRPLLFPVAFSSLSLLHRLVLVYSHVLQTNSGTDLGGEDVWKMREEMAGMAGRWIKDLKR